MKKVFYTLALGVLFSSAFSSCKKCGHCSSSPSDKTCQTGNAVQDLVYSSAKNSCEGSGGTWVTE